MSAASLALMSAACSSQPEPEPASHASPPPAPAPKPIAPATKPVAKAKPAPSPAVASPAPAAAPPAPAAAPPPITVIGLSRGDVEAVLGQPASRSNSGSGQSWSYTSDICQLQLFFFLDVQRNDFFALDQKISGTDGTDAGTQRCLKRIADAKPR